MFVYISMKHCFGWRLKTIIPPFCFYECVKNYGIKWSGIRYTSFSTHHDEFLPRKTTKKLSISGKFWNFSAIWNMCKKFSVVGYYVWLKTRCSWHTPRTLCIFLCIDWIFRPNYNTSHSLVEKVKLDKLSGSMRI